MSDPPKWSNRTWPALQKACTYPFPITPAFFPAEALLSWHCDHFLHSLYSDSIYPCISQQYSLLEFIFELYINRIIQKKIVMVMNILKTIKDNVYMSEWQYSQWFYYVGSEALNLNPPQQVAGLTVLALSHLPSGLDLLILPVGQHKLTFKSPSELCVCEFLWHLDGKVLTWGWGGL